MKLTDFHLICPYCKNKFIAKKEYVSWRDEECFDFRCLSCGERFNLLSESCWVEMHDVIAQTMLLFLLWIAAIIFKTLLIHELQTLIPILILAVLCGIIAIRSLLLKLMQIIHNNFCTKWAGKQDRFFSIKKPLIAADSIIFIFLLMFLLLWGAK